MEGSYKVAVAGAGDALIQTHFGHAKRFEIFRFDASKAVFTFLETRQVAQYCQGSSQCDDDEQQKQQIISAVADCQQVLCARMGIAPWRTLEKLGVKPNVDFAFRPVEQALAALASTLASSSAATLAPVSLPTSVESQR